MGSKSTITQTTKIPGAGGSEASAQQLLSQLAQSGVGQLGDLSELAAGDLNISPQDEALLRRIANLSGEAARGQIQDNAAMQSSQLEDRLLGRGIPGSSIEAVDEALIGRQLQQSLDQSAIQGQITSAQQLRQQSLDRAGIQLNANQLLLEQILGGASTVANMGLQERLVQTTSKKETETPFSAGSAAQLAGRGLSAFATSGASEIGGV